MEKLMPPCSYQGGKQRLAKQIVDIIFQENDINEQTTFFDVCCGSGAFSLELVNRGIKPQNITMIDNGCFGSFWESVAKGNFDIEIFRREIEKLPRVEKIQEYLKHLSNCSVNVENLVYHYLLLQAGSFGSKQIWIQDMYWKTAGFRSYWLPTEKSNRKSVVNPMMPLPQTLLNRTENILVQMGKKIKAVNENVFFSLHIFDGLESNNAVIYIDPPYSGTTGYETNFDINELILSIGSKVPIYISEGNSLDGCKKSFLLSKGRKKGNISGNSKKPIEEWLNLF